MMIHVWVAWKNANNFCDCSLIKARSKADSLPWNVLYSAISSCANSNDLHLPLTCLPMQRPASLGGNTLKVSTSVPQVIARFPSPSALFRSRLNFRRNCTTDQCKKDKDESVINAIGHQSHIHENVQPTIPLEKRALTCNFGIFIPTEIWKNSF